jgi:hypothetical protein
MVVGGQRHAPAALPPRKKLGTHCVGGWVGPKAGVDASRKSFLPEIDPRTFQPVASRYTWNKVKWLMHCYNSQTVCSR